ncbi:MAG: hypothetical protein QNK50_07420 [Flavobacteriaceae bacterium]
MKKLLLLSALLIFSSSSDLFAQKDECAKAFIKVKKSKKKSSVFEDIKSFKTKPVNIYANGKRHLVLSFSFDGEKSRLRLRSMLISSGLNPLKKPFVLSQNIRIAFVFEDGSNEIIRFKTAEQDLTGTKHEWDVYKRLTENDIMLSDEFLNKLAVKTVKSIDILNPFGKLNESDVISKELIKGQVKYLKRFANCFLDRLKTM